jgi:hypothetical protein
MSDFLVTLRLRPVTNMVRISCRRGMPLKDNPQLSTRSQTNDADKFDQGTLSGWRLLYQLSYSRR